MKPSLSLTGKPSFPRHNILFFPSSTFPFSSLPLLLQRLFQTLFITTLTYSFFSISLIPTITMSFLLLFFLFLFLTPSLSQTTPPKGFLIDCGSLSNTQINNRSWLPDSAFITTGTPKNITSPVLLQTLKTLRSFSLQVKKNCYNVPVYRGAKYMVRTTYFYGGVNGPDHPSPPVFDQIVDGTLWSVVNTTEDYVNGNSTFYEGIFLAKGKFMSLCLGSNTYTDSDPFISALEFLILKGSLYNTTDFTNFALGLVARNSFGFSGSPIRLVRHCFLQLDSFCFYYDNLYVVGYIDHFHLVMLLLSCQISHVFCAL